MEELIDILDENGALTGTSFLKSEVHKQGLYHQTVHIWLYTKKGELLIQQRGKNKTTFPLLWDISVAGHIAAGEKVLEAAVREIEEEIGLIIKADRLTKIGIIKSEFVHNPSFTDREFNHIFIYELQVALDQLKMQEEEVEALRLIAVKEYVKQIENKNSEFVPISLDYLNLLCNEVDKRISS